jgi:methyl-accepting chemotaxis protein
VSTRRSFGFGISAKLILLSVVVAIGMVATMALSRNSLGRLAENARAQGTSSSTAFAASDFRKKVTISWLTLYRLDHEILTGSDVASQSAENLAASLKDDATALQGLLALQVNSAQAEAIASVKAAYDGFAADCAAAASAAMAASAAPARRAAHSPFEVAGPSYAALVAALERFDNIVRQEQVQLTFAGRTEAAASASLMTLVPAAILLAVLTIALLTVLSITRPLAVLVATVERIAGGDFTVKAIGRTGGELGVIAAGVNRLMSDLKGLICTVKDRLAALESTGHGLAAAMEETGAAVIQINANIANTVGQLEEQSAAVRDVHAGTGEVARSAEALASLIARQSSVIADSSASVEEMIANVESIAGGVEGSATQADRLAEEGENGRARIDEVGKAVETIVASSQKLGEATRVISEIAERTTLLAMNAAIEAAHAGASGRGFAVVAQEIRKLAVQSTAQAKDISEDLARVTVSIEGVRGAAKEAVGAFGSILDHAKALSETMATIGSAAGEQKEGGRQVLEGLVRLKDITQDILQGSDGMASANQAILGHVERLRNANEVVVRNNQEITLGTKGINDAVVETIELSARNGELIRDVKDAADRFILDEAIEATCTE